MIQHIDFIEVAGTSKEPEKNPSVQQFTALLAEKTAPVFEPKEDANVSEVVAVLFRSGDGKPKHGGIFGFGVDGSVVSIALKDLEGRVDTSQNPSHAALGLTMMRGPLVFRQGGVDVQMPLSIIDLNPDNAQDPVNAPTAAREAVRKAYINDVLPEHVRSLSTGDLSQALTAQGEFYFGELHKGWDGAAKALLDAVKNGHKTDGVFLAVTGREHFGNPIPRAWYATGEAFLNGLNEGVDPSNKASKGPRP